MPTNFPTSVDNFTNPTANDSLNLPSHSTQHANANDAIEAIETYLLPGGTGAIGLAKIVPTGATNGTVAANGDVTIGSAVSSVTVSGAFSATYDNYRIVFSGLTASSGTAFLQLRFAALGNHYGTLQYDSSSGTNSGNNRQNAQQQVSILTSATASGSMGLSMDVQNPFTSAYTTLSGTGFGGTFTNWFGGSYQVNTSFTDFTILPSAGTITGGTIRIYGYK